MHLALDLSGACILAKNLIFRDCGSSALVIGFQWWLFLRTRHALMLYCAIEA